MSYKVCGSCEFFESCRKWLWVSEYTEQQSVLDCYKGEKNVPLVDEEGREISEDRV